MTHDDVMLVDLFCMRVGERWPKAYAIVRDPQGWDR